MTYFDLRYNFTERFCPIFNTVHDRAVLYRVENHLTKLIEIGKVKTDQVVMIVLEGSQNYKLDTNTSDVDTKVIVVPTLDDIVWNRKPVSTTAILENGEHANITDVRLYFASLRKQNVNFIETLYSPWIIVNTEYEKEVELLLKNRDLISHYNTVKAVKTMSGIAKDRYKAIYNKNSQRADIIERYGYDGKAISHVVRLYHFVYHYTKDFSYSECLIPNEEARNLILNLKNNKMDADLAGLMATAYYDEIQKVVDRYVFIFPEEINDEAEKALAQIQEDIVRKALHC